MSLLDEIREQPEALARLLRSQADLAVETARRIRAAGVHWVLIAARGSSDNAAIYAKYLWGSLDGLPVALAAPSLFTHYGAPPRLAGALVVGISQSGQSPDIVSVLAEARRQGALTLAITNDSASPLAAQAEMVFDTCCGPERSIAATKTYTSQLLSVALLATALAGDEPRREALARVPGLVRATLERESAIERAAARHRAMTHCLVLGRGFQYATACEWSLKLKELAYVIAEPYSTADFRHGPLAIANPGLPVLAPISGGAVFEEVLAMLRLLVAERGVDLVVLSGEPRALELASTGLALPPDLPEWLSPIVSIVPAQLFCFHLTRARGLDAEAPRGLSKVTRTW